MGEKNYLILLFGSHFFGDYGFGEQVFCFKKNVFVNAINAQTFWRKKITLFVSSGCKSAF